MCAIGSTKQSRSSPPSVNWLDFLLQFVIFPLFLNRSKRLIVLFAYTCAWISFYPSPSMSYYLEEGWSRMPLLSHTLSESGSFLQMKWEDKPSREKKKSRERDRWDHCLSCAAIIYTCGIFNLAHFRHLTSQGSLASSSPWQSPATGSKTSFSSCRPSTTGRVAAGLFTYCQQHRLPGKNRKRKQLLFCSIFITFWMLRIYPFWML